MNNETDTVERLYERHCQGDDLCGEAQGIIESLEARNAGQEEELSGWINGVNAFPDCKDLAERYDELKNDHRILANASTVLQEANEAKITELQGVVDSLINRTEFANAYLKDQMYENVRLVNDETLKYAQKHASKK